jgi:hypothetical protein
MAKPGDQLGCVPVSGQDEANKDAPSCKSTSWKRLLALLAASILLAIITTLSIILSRNRATGIAQSPSDFGGLENDNAAFPASTSPFSGHIKSLCDIHNTVLYSFNYTLCLGFNKTAVLNDPSACSGFTVLSSVYLTCLSENDTTRVQAFDMKVAGIKVKPLGAPRRTVLDKVKVATAAALDWLMDKVASPSETPMYEGDSAGFAGTFQFLRNAAGKVVEVRSAPGEDPQVSNFKRGIAEVRLLPAL